MSSLEISLRSFLLCLVALGLIIRLLKVGKKAVEDQDYAVTEIE
ncbi:hypothetical protein HMPREF7215_1940 [Pyramidobacter piscolens W5455]|uniref:Uncharacterized protein n=1 Tax=Pyramidobacter piscolens W5455 TaxID=352165 RepID=A0ABM9ZU71_9BACT|nr:hypothetical protein HMPREF7215_1940 [Pyramidobacter piscolens W5455]